MASARPSCDVDVSVKHIVIVGDGAVGKTCLLHCYVNGSGFIEDYVPTIYEKEEFTLKLDNTVHLIKLHDTAGQEIYDSLRAIIYKEADVFVVCYSVGNLSSFENVKLKWLPELRATKRSIPIVLVGTKTDHFHRNVATANGEHLKDEINANAFLECSAKTNHNVKEVIYEAVRAAVNGVPLPRTPDTVWTTFWNCCR